MSNTPVMDRLVRKTVERHLPWNAHIDLTYRCNERCVHCYLDHHDYGEMTTREVKNVLDQLADAEMSHVRDGPGTVVVAELGGGFLAGIHARNAGATGVMRRPFRDVVNFACDDDPAIVPRVVPGDFFAGDRTWLPGGNSGRPEFSGDRGDLGPRGFAEVPRSQSFGG